MTSPTVSLTLSPPRDWPRRAAACLAAERNRWALWGPVALGLGIGLYFALGAEPAPWAGAAALLGALVLMWASRRRGALHLLAWALTLAAFGFSAAQLRTRMVEAPVIAKSTGAVRVDGIVGRVELRDGYRRLLLEPLGIGRLDPAALPARVRIRIHGMEPPLRPGDRIRVRARLEPPPGPAAPGAFDFARRAWFERLGAVGFAVGRVAVVEHRPPAGLAGRIEALRHDLTRRILDALPGPPGAVAAALMTGERGAIPEEVLAAMRDSGLAHLLAISGLHIGLVGGLLFFAVRLLLAAHETVALRFPIKKWAALAAVAGSFGYLLVSGATLPTQRAFLMLGLALLAVLIDRVAISMNLVAWAALVILVLAPESLLSVSFQMSFAAVIALVAAYETAVLRRARAGLPPGPVRRAALYLGAVLLSTLVAGLATAPFALFHFNRFALYGMLANLIAVPLTALWIMPWAVAAFALMPFGLEGLALAPMGLGIEAVIAVAQWVQGLSGAVLSLPALMPAGVLLITFGGLWLCLWQVAGWRSLGLIGIVAGTVVAAPPAPPDILVADDARAAAVRDTRGGLVFLAGGKGFVADSWRRRVGVSDGSPAAAAPALRCDPLGCVYRRAGGGLIAYGRDIAALGDDCARAAVVISREPVRRWQCYGPSLVIGRFDLWRNGAHAVWLERDGPRVVTVGDDGGRPWSRYPRRPRRRVAKPQ